MLPGYAGANAPQLLAAVEEYGGPEGFVREADDILSYTSLCDDFISVSNLLVSSQSAEGFSSGPECSFFAIQMKWRLLKNGTLKWELL